MTISLRLNPALARLLARRAKESGLSKSELIRRCLDEYLNETSVSAWELGKELFGRHGAGNPNLARDRKRILREKIHARDHCD